MQSTARENRDFWHHAMSGASRKLAFSANNRRRQHLFKSNYRSRWDHDRRLENFISSVSQDETNSQLNKKYLDCENCFDSIKRKEYRAEAVKIIKFYFIKSLAASLWMERQRWNNNDYRRPVKQSIIRSNRTRTWNAFARASSLRLLIAPNEKRHIWISPQIKCKW